MLTLRRLSEFVRLDVKFVTINLPPYIHLIICDLPHNRKRN